MNIQNLLISCSVATDPERSIANAHNHFSSTTTVLQRDSAIEIAENCSISSVKCALIVTNFAIVYSVCY